VSQLRDLSATGRGTLSLCGDTMSPFGHTSTLLTEGHHAGHEPYLDCVSGNRNSSAAFHPPAVSAAPDGMSLRRGSQACRGSLVRMPVAGTQQLKAPPRWLRPVLPSGEPENGTAEGPPSEVPCSDYCLYCKRVAVKKCGGGPKAAPVTADYCLSSRRDLAVCLRSSPLLLVDLLRRCWAAVGERDAVGHAQFAVGGKGVVYADALP